jgi:uncharacterized protein with HEPN domain
MERRNRVILKKILSESNVLAESVSDCDKDAFLSNELLSRAACMTLINVGELVKNLTDEFRQKHREIPWKNIAGLRDIAAHGYFTLRMDDIWIYVVNDMPELSAKINDILDSEPIEE